MIQEKKREYFKTDVHLCFDPDYIDCKHCPLLETYSREVCRITGELITNDRCVGNFCPFLDEVIEDQINYEYNKIKGDEKK